MPYQPPSWTHVILPRNNSGPMPENTLAAIVSAIRFGVNLMNAGLTSITTNRPERMLLHARGRTARPNRNQS